MAGFDTWPVGVGFMVHKVAQGQILLRVCVFSRQYHYTDDFLLQFHLSTISAVQVALSLLDTRSN
jgi:hypothetical protein